VLYTKLITWGFVIKQFPRQALTMLSKDREDSSALAFRDCRDCRSIPAFHLVATMSSQPRVVSCYSDKVGIE